MRIMVMQYMTLAVPAMTQLCMPVATIKSTSWMMAKTTVAGQGEYMMHPPTAMECRPKQCRYHSLNDFKSSRQSLQRQTLMYFSHARIRNGFFFVVHSALLFVAFIDFGSDFYDFWNIVGRVHPKSRYLATKTIQTRSQMSRDVTKTQRIVWDVPVVSQMKGLQKFKYHINIFAWVQRLQRRTSNSSLFLFLFTMMVGFEFDVINMKQTQKQSYHKSPKSPLIRIETPTSLIIATSSSQSPSPRDVSKMLMEEIVDVKEMIKQSKIVLENSRREGRSKEKIVASDRMPLEFVYTTNRKVTYQTLKAVNQDFQFEYDQTGKEEGQIQLPLHLEQKRQDRHLLSAKNDFDRLDSSSQYFSARSVSQDITSLSKDLQKKKEIDLQIRAQQGRLKYKVKKSAETTSRKLNDKQYKEIFGKSQNLLKFKELCQRSVGDRHFKTEEQRMNQSFETRLPLDLQFERSLSKERKERIQVKQRAKNPNNVKLHLTKPNLNQPSRYAQFVPKKQSAKVGFPLQKSLELKSSLQNSKDKGLESDWLWLKRKIQKYDLVAKTLKEGELYRMYDYLRKSGVPKEKWVLFIVDETYRKIS